MKLEAFKPFQKNAWAQAIFGQPIPIEQQIAALFTRVGQGTWYDPSTFSNLYQDAAGTTPAVVRQPVGLVLDRSRGLDGPELVTTLSFAVANNGGSIGSYSNGDFSNSAIGGSSLYPHFSHSMVLERDKTYRVSVRFSGNISRINRINFDTGSATASSGRGTVAGSLLAASGGAYDYIVRLTSADITSPERCRFVVWTDGTSVWDDLSIESLSIRELPGNHATQTVSASRPHLVDDMALWFGSGTSLAVNFATAPGTDCTVASAVPGTGVSIQTGQTIGAGSYTISADTAGFMIFDRALSPRETSLVTKYLEMKLAILEFVEFDFAALPIDPRITFTRASAGTYFDPNGVMQAAAINQPRIDHDPVTGDVRGLLVEEQRTNLSLWSEDFGNATWDKARSTITANALIAPDGTLSGYLLSDTTNNGSHALQANRSKASSAITYTFSYYARAGSFPRSRILMAGLSFSNIATATIDLENGQVDIPATTAGNFSNASVKVRDVGDGWYRIALTATSDTTSVIRYDLRIDNGTTDSYVGSGGGNIGVWGAQLEAGTFPTSYIPTEGAAVTRAADVSDVADITDIRLNPTEGTFLVEHDAPAGRPLLSSGANLIAVSQGPGVFAVAYDGSGSAFYQDGASAGTGAALSFDTGLRIGASASEKANARILRARYYSRKLSPSEISGVWA